MPALEMRPPKHHTAANEPKRPHIQQRFFVDWDRRSVNNGCTSGVSMFVNPFAGIAASIPPLIMQAYVIAMILLVALGTVYDTIHKGSAKYFFQSMRSANSRAGRQVGGGEKLSLALETAAEGLTSAEFCNPQRRIAHLLTMYGFIIYVITTGILVFAYPTETMPAPAFLPQLWYLGAFMICAGGYWFWFFIRVDVAAEGHSPLRIVRADLFVLSLIASATLALVWAYLEAQGNSWSTAFLGAYLIATTVLFGSVPWSKFSHMFFKPAAAFQKRLAEANGSRSNLPAPADKPATFGSARRQPRNY
jgi:hypothetical protein